jgi:ATP-dependent DNA helicase 2 subunit 2
VHRINQVITHRAVHPDDPIPAPIDILTKFSDPPADLIKGSEKVQQKLIETFNVKKGSFMPSLSKIDQS